MVNANINNAQRPADAGGFHKTLEYKQTSRHNVFESAILHNIEMSLRLIRCKIVSNCENAQVSVIHRRNLHGQRQLFTAGMDFMSSFPRPVVQYFSRHHA